MASRVASIRRSANLWIYARYCFSGLTQLASPARRIVSGGQGRNLEPRRPSCRGASRSVRADSDARAGRAGEHRARRAQTKAEAEPAAGHILRGLRGPAADAAVADRHRAAIARARAARRPGLAIAVAGGTADRAPRGDQGSAGQRRRARPADPGRLRRHRGPPLLPPLGDRPARHRPGDDRQCAGRRSAPGRQHDHPAARQDQLPVERPKPQAQGPGSDHLLLARSLADQGRNPVALSVEHLFRRRGLWAAGGGPALFRPLARTPDARAIGDAGRGRAGAVAAGPDAQPQARPEARPIGARRDGRDRGDQRSAVACGRSGAAGPARLEGADRHLFRRLGRAGGAKGVRSRFRRSQSPHDARCRPAAYRGPGDQQRRDRRRPGGDRRNEARRPSRRDGRRAKL